MNITGELREWARQFRRVWVDPHSGDLTYITNEHACPPSLDAVRLEDYITAIADRIDAEHEGVWNSGLRLAHDAYVRGKATADDAFEEMQDTHVKLPVDADGEPIHIGDVMDSSHYEDGTVIGIQFCEGGRWLIAVKPHDWDTPTWRDPECYRHHRAPTVEDVLERALNEAAMLDRQEGYWPSAADITNIVNSLASKLRLREDA